MNAVIENTKGQRLAKVSAFAYVLLCTLFLFTLKCEGTEEMENMGIMVNLGTVDEGMLEDNIPTSPDNETVEAASEAASEEASSSEAELESTTQDLVPTNVNATPKPSNPTPKPTNNNSNTTQTPTNNTSPTKPQQTVNNEGLFAPNQGTGNNPGDQGNPNGNLESDIYGDISGSGFGGSGDGASLAGRSTVYKPIFSNPTNEFGKVVIKITVDKTGKVTKAELVALYSTNTNKALVDYAIQEAYKFKFNNVSGENNAKDKQIGKIVYNFTAN